MGAEEVKAVAGTELHVGRRHVLKIAVWATLRDLRLVYWQKTKKRDRTVGGFFLAPLTHIGPRCVVRERIVGEIHLVKGRFAAGVWAHELQHFIQWWINVKDLEPMERDWERVAKLTGDLTNEFWIWFYNESGLNL